MKYFLLFVAFVVPCVLACSSVPEKEDISASEELPIVGTWRLLSGTTIKAADTVVTDYTIGQEMIKIISPTHFAFLRHDLNHGKDSTASYAAGGGRVLIGDSSYTEFLKTIACFPKCRRITINAFHHWLLFLICTTDQ